MIKSRGYAATDKKTPLGPFSFERRELLANDVLIEIAFCGICHSDLHQVKDEWNGTTYPIVPGHEVVGTVTRVGSGVTKFKVGDLAGVGCMVGSCGTCVACVAGNEQYCTATPGTTWAYNSPDKHSGGVTYGGYSNNVVVDAAFALKISPKLDLARTAPLLCAGITTYSPLRHWQVEKGQTVGIVGLGGLGHMGVKLARAMGAEVVVFTTSEKKKKDAIALGAHEVVVSTDAAAMNAVKGRFHLIIDTVSADHDIAPYLAALRHDGSVVLVGLPEKPIQVPPFSVVSGRKSLSGSLIGGVRETQEMLDYCAEHEVLSDIELIPIQKINEAYERLLRGDVRYRFVLDMKSL